MKVLRKLGFPAMVLAGMLAIFTPSSANARVRFGVQIGGPVYPTYTYPYPYYGSYYAYPYSYSYVAPYSTYGYGYRYQPRYERWEHRNHERWENRHYRR